MGKLSIQVALKLLSKTSYVIVQGGGSPHLTGEQSKIKRGQFWQGGSRGGIIRGNYIQF